MKLLINNLLLGNPILEGNIFERKIIVMQRKKIYDRILGCLVTAGMGDAMGAPSEALSQDEIIKTFKGRITTFHKPGDTIYAGGNLLGEYWSSENLKNTYGIKKG